MEVYGLQDVFYNERSGQAQARVHGNPQATFLTSV